MLIVDDDIRNIYSLASVLESQRRDRAARRARRRRHRDLLEQNPDIDLALIDIMMPEMDGYETMQRIRDNPAARQHPADRGHRQGDEGRPAEMPRRRAPPTTSPSRSTSICCSPCCGCGSGARKPTAARPRPRSQTRRVKRGRPPSPPTWPSTRKPWPPWRQPRADPPGRRRRAQPAGADAKCSSRSAEVVTATSGRVACAS